MKKFFSEFHYEKNLTLTKIMIFVLFLPVLIGYYITINLKNVFNNHFKGKKFDALTISIGNITTGGVGKTPISAEIANFLVKNGKKTAILSRGYGGKLNGKEVNIISNGEKIFFSANKAGDEVFWLCKNCPNCFVLTCHSRIKSAKKAIEHDINTFVLDDGFQHRKLERDLDIVVIDSEKQFGNGFLIPYGPLREPVSELKRADKIIVVNKNSNSQTAQIYVKELENKFKKPVFLCNMEISDIYEINNKQNKIDSSRVIAFCSIAQPTQFYWFLNNFEIVKTVEFNDHHQYSEKDINDLFKIARENDVQMLITTEKDAVKLTPYLDNNSDIKIYAAKMSPKLDVEKVLEGYL